LRHKCLDKGYVELVTNTPDGDLLVVNSARASFDKQHSKFDKEKDSKLIKYLAKHKHFLPFRHPNITLRFHMPIFVARQALKHQVGMSASEVSRRYIDSIPEFYAPGRFRARPDGIKQGSTTDGPRMGHVAAANCYSSAINRALLEYNKLLDGGVAPEMARCVLPVATYTTVVWTGTLLAWHHFYKLRSESHAQVEIQEYAQAVEYIMKDLFPISWEALND